MGKRPVPSGRESTPSAELRARRKPRFWFRFSGQFLLRYAERQFLASLFQLPPRITRFEPMGRSPRHNEYRSRLALARLTATQRGARGRRAPRWVAVKRRSTHVSSSDARGTATSSGGKLNKSCSMYPTISRYSGIKAPARLPRNSLIRGGSKRSVTTTSPSIPTWTLALVRRVSSRPVMIAGQAAIDDAETPSDVARAPRRVAFPVRAGRGTISIYRPPGVLQRILKRTLGRQGSAAQRMRIERPATAGHAFQSQFGRRF